MLLAVDPGMSAMGYAVLSLDGEPVELGVIRTEPSPKKRKMLVVEDSLRRVREIARNLHRIVGTHCVCVVACEAMSFPRSSSSSAKLGMSWAALATVAEMSDLPMLQATPQMVRKALLGHAGSKDDMAKVVARRLGLKELPIPGVPASLHDHVYDAVAVGLYAMSSDLVRAMRSSGLGHLDAGDRGRVRSV